MCDDRPSVCHVTTVHTARDTRIFEKQCTSLARSGYRVHLVAPSCVDERLEGVELLGLSVHRSRLLRATLGQFSAVWRAWSVRASIYHFHDPELIAAAILLRLRGAAVVYDSHEDLESQVECKRYLPEWSRWLTGRLANVLVRSWGLVANKVIAATPSISLLFPPNKTTIVQNFPPAPQGRPLEAERIRGAVCFVGGISIDRGLANILEALVVDEKLSVSLVLAGRFAFANEELVARSHPAWHRVDFRGQVDRNQANEIMGSSRAGLLTYLPHRNHVESQPNKLFEYMAAGLPVIASDFPSWRHIVQSHRCGLLVDPNDPRAICEAIEWIVNNPLEAKEMGLRGRAAICSDLHWEAEFAKLDKVYRSVGLSAL